MIDPATTIGAVIATGAVVRTTTPDGEPEEFTAPTPQLIRRVLEGLHRL